MRKVVQMIMGMVLCVALLTGATDFVCLAAELGDMTSREEIPEDLEAIVFENMEWSEEIMPKTSLVQCIISISGSDEGMVINITTGASGKASVIGVKDVKIQKKVWYGWKTVATSSGGETYDHTMVGIRILYENAIKDETYRIKCVHYGDVNGYVESENDTDAFVYTY